ncbi:ACT domain-containing protein [Primorskyibacter sp. S87]|uniref:ACT domain-containing protein n=1 Tax=Primorskyibacter sp. S87 TaxID=3415126 RepID=UPI003C7C2A3E
MSTPVGNRDDMISGMNPDLRPGVFAFAHLPSGSVIPAEAIGSFDETEGVSLILPLEVAPAGSQPMRCITLKIHSALDGVGLTAAVSNALAEVDIPANVVAAFHHDHVFVPADLAERALEALRILQRAHGDD